MVPAEWASVSPPWLSTPSEVNGATARVLFTRTVRRRNFKGFPFWVSCPPETCSTVAQHAREYAGTVGFSRPVVLPDYGSESIGFFREKQWLPERPVTFPGKRDFKLLFLGSDPAQHVLVGEVEHWTQIHVRPGLPESVDIPATPGLMDRHGPFSHSPGYEFLTSNPSFAGSGLQVECAIHIPALTALRRLQPTQQALNAMGVELHPLTVRVPGAAEAGFFRVLSRGGMKFPEDVLYEEFARKIQSLLATEIEAFDQWRKQEQKRLEDRIFRSLRLLQEARTLDYTEYLTFDSFTRTGIYSGHFTSSLLPKLEELRVRSQPFHIAVTQGRPVSPETDVFRAELARSLLQSAGSGG
jgi:protein arginine kinase